MNFKALENKIQYTFNDTKLLTIALTHRSYSRNNYERLEFLGDSLLDYNISLELYYLYPDLSEGELSKLRSALVNEQTLVEIANYLEIGNYLLLGDGEIKNNGRNRPSILADVVEALIAAVSIDGSVYAAQTVIKLLYKERLHNVLSYLNKDSKSLLQEYLQARKLEVPIYNIIESTGPLHDALFTIECEIRELNIKVTATGKTKKESSQNAATKMLQKLGIK